MPVLAEVLHNAAGLVANFSEWNWMKLTKVKDQFKQVVDSQLLFYLNGSQFWHVNWFSSCHWGCFCFREVIFPQIYLWEI